MFLYIWGHCLCAYLYVNNLSQLSRLLQLLLPLLLLFPLRCDETEHFDLLQGEGRGATEIDIIEIMPGEAGRLPMVTTPIERPYVAMTLQVGREQSRAA